MGVFGRKKRARRMLRLADAGGCALYDGALSAFAVPEDVVLRLSVAFFDDPEPCHIHRSAVHARICLELCEACEGRGIVRISSLDEPLRAYFDVYAGVDTLEIYINT